MRSWRCAHYFDKDICIGPDSVHFIYTVHAVFKQLDIAGTDYGYMGYF